MPFSYKTSRQTYFFFLAAAFFFFGAAFLVAFFAFFLTAIVVFPISEVDQIENASVFTAHPRHKRIIKRNFTPCQNLFTKKTRRSPSGSFCCFTSFDQRERDARELLRSRSDGSRSVRLVVHALLESSVLRFGRRNLAVSGRSGSHRLASVCVLRSCVNSRRDRSSSRRHCSGSSRSSSRFSLSEVGNADECDCAEDESESEVLFHCGDLRFVCGYSSGWRPF